MGDVNGRKLEAICDSIEQITDGGCRQLDLEGLDAEEALLQLLALAGGAEDLLMCMRNTLTGVGLTLPRPAAARRSA